jgi:hypothetical protein
MIREWADGELMQLCALSHRLNQPTHLLLTQPAIQHTAGKTVAFLHKAHLVRKIKMRLGFWKR